MYCSIPSRRTVRSFSRNLSAIVLVSCVLGCTEKGSSATSSENEDVEGEASGGSGTSVLDTEESSTSGGSTAVGSDGGAENTSSGSAVGGDNGNGGEAPVSSGGGDDGDDGDGVGGEGGEGGAPPEETCWGIQGATAPECEGHQLCLSEFPAIDVNEGNCSTLGGGCSWSFMENAGDTLTYENEQGWVFLRFDRLSGGETTEQIRSSFEHANFYAKFPISGPERSEATSFEVISEWENLEALEIRDGALHFHATFELGTPYFHVLTENTFCGDTNECVCKFSGPRESTSFEVQLPYEGR